ncbi:MAG: MATE family efflux transporter [Bacteroidales bacterium]|nr:MATE family efflux transporter [Bacteroidales bacterium]MDD2425586.1 MATE family efflux transporter [Bacteroidales bacterium]MDD3988859.1 MATE family efflux transporter [Bacteroidales bacterium]MDD4638995.1 MATE family efflux transporter [Bacteroidales bacterium]
MPTCPIYSKSEYLCSMNFRDYIPYYKTNLKLAIPVMLTQAGQITVNLADNIMVGHLGATELASVSFANSIIILGMVFGIGFTQGVTPHVGQSFGRGDHSGVAALLKNSIALNLVVSLLITIVMAVAGLFMDYMGQTEQVVTMGRGYYNIMLFSMFPSLMFFGLRQFSEGIGITKYAMYLTLAVNMLNIFLNWVLIYGKLGFEPMGIRGAAIATLTSRYIVFFAFLILYFKNKNYNRYLLQKGSGLLNRLHIKSILKTSIPLSFQNLVEITAFSMSAIMVGWNGEISLASHQIAMSMSSFSFMLALGVGAAATIRVSHLYGFRDYNAMRKAGFASVHLSVVLMSLCGIAYIIFRKEIPYIFTNVPEVNELASKLLIISALFQVFDAIQLSSLAALRALADVKKPLFMSVISYYLVCLPLGYICGTLLDLGVIGVWTGLSLGLVFAAVLFLVRFNKISRKLTAVQEGTVYTK